MGKLSIYLSLSFIQTGNFSCHSVSSSLLLLAYRLGTLLPRIVPHVPILALLSVTTGEALSHPLATNVLAILPLNGQVRSISRLSHLPIHTSFLSILIFIFIYIGNFCETCAYASDPTYCGPGTLDTNTCACQCPANTGWQLPRCATCSWTCSVNTITIRILIRRNTDTDNDTDTATNRMEALAILPAMDAIAWPLGRVKIVRNVRGMLRSAKTTEYLMPELANVLVLLDLDGKYDIYI